MALRAGTRVHDDALQTLALAERIRNHMNSMTAKSRAMRTILEALFAEFLAASPSPHEAFDGLEPTSSPPSRQRWTQRLNVPESDGGVCCSLHAKAILSELQRNLPNNKDKLGAVLSGTV